MQSKDVVLWQGQVVYEIPQEFRVLLFKASRSGPTSERTAFRRDMFDWRFFDSEAQMMSSYASPSQGGEGYRLALWRTATRSRHLQNPTSLTEDEPAG